MPSFTYDAYLQILIINFRTATVTQFSHNQSVDLFILQSIAVCKIFIYF